MLKNNTIVLKIIIIFFLLISVFNVKLYVDNYVKLKDESVTVTNTIEKTYGFVDALEILYSYENLNIDNIEVENDRCIYTISFNGQYDELLSILEYLIGFDEVISIDNINIKNMKDVTFNIEFIKNK
ncbi:hypothetical protein [Clostridium ihumii]|uniref:hypothetical protein n=1 Tax=Clostridium ihumii TaxID=1470356 RepID=UPI00058F45BB|nr:hypothetical protein [Clostridium ihumii]